MTKKKVESFKGGSISSDKPQIQNIAKTEWKLESMLKDDDIVGKITAMQGEGWEVFQLIPTGSYFSILFARG